MNVNIRSGTYINYFYKYIWEKKNMTLTAKVASNWI